jgi:hypothetical protein
MTGTIPIEPSAKNRPIGVYVMGLAQYEGDYTDDADQHCGTDLQQLVRKSGQIAHLRLEPLLSKRHSKELSSLKRRTKTALTTTGIAVFKTHIQWYRQQPLQVRGRHPPGINF